MVVTTVEMMAEKGLMKAVKKAWRKVVMKAAKMAV